MCSRLTAGSVAIDSAVASRMRCALRRASARARRGSKVDKAVYVRVRGKARRKGETVTEREQVRTSNRTMPMCTVIPELVYEDVGEAIDWLCDKLGFAVRWRAGDHRAQLSFAGGTVAITEPRTSKALTGRQSLMVRVDDAHAHHDRARDRGATVIRAPEDFPYGERQYTVEDLGGHHWTFSQSIADLAPEAWGGTTGPALEDESRAPSLDFEQP